MFLSVPVSGTGNTGIMLVDYRQRPFNADVRVLVPSTETATFTVYQTLDDPKLQIQPTSITQSTTTATLTSTNHGLNTTDWIRVQYSGSSKLDGFYQVASVTNKDVITYTVTSGSDTAGAFTTYTPFRMISISALAAKSASTETTIVAPCRGLLGLISAHSGGTGQLTFQVLQGPSSA